MLIYQIGLREFITYCKVGDAHSLSCMLTYAVWCCPAVLLGHAVSGNVMLHPFVSSILVRTTCFVLGV